MNWFYLLISSETYFHSIYLTYFSGMYSFGNEKMPNFDLSRGLYSRTYGNTA